MVFGWVDLNVENLVKELNKTDNLLVSNHEGSISSLVEDTWKNLEYTKSLLTQKSRQVWLREGEQNSRFFHHYMKERYKRNHINVVDSSNGRVEGVNELENDVMCHFESFFKESRMSKSVPDGIEFKCLSEEENNSLEEPYSEWEIKETIWSYDGSKSVDPDGFTFEFPKKCWETIKEYVFNFVKDFHSKEKQN
ncbi:uncharacterized protein LOC127097950 [Lathyrus oleraceus]|uniref:uncharacterized protein LOC127097950 n=1 Tax=Pisum sativum TaxID=3888 RepID=UPI0021CE28ED|nr:uncharacterized protein LOC127097950 [Pisum sativum]